MPILEVQVIGRVAASARKNLPGAAGIAGGNRLSRSRRCPILLSFLRWHAACPIRGE